MQNRNYFRWMELIVLIGIGAGIILAIITAKNELWEQMEQHHQTKSFFSATGSLALAQFCGSEASVFPPESLLEQIGAEDFPEWERPQQILFLTFNALTDRDSAAYPTSLISLAKKHNLLTAWKSDLEFRHDNTVRDEVKRKCGQYIKYCTDAERR